VERLDVGLNASSVTRLAWTSSPGADVYSVTRGDLSLLDAGQYGGCLIEGLEGCSYLDTENPPPGEGWFYLVQGQNFDCGMGPLGYTSMEQERSNGDPGACSGHPHTDAYSTAEETVYGDVTGTHLDTHNSDDTVESILEEESGGNPSLRFSRLEHRWTVPVAPGTRIEFHVEGFRTDSPDGDTFRFEYSTNGGTEFAVILTGSLPFADDDIDLMASLPSYLSGNVIFRVVDTDRTPGNRDLDTVSVDELFVRSIQ
jgi:hypothetical protein